MGVTVTLYSPTSKGRLDVSCVTANVPESVSHAQDTQQFDAVRDGKMKRLFLILHPKFFVLFLGFSICLSNTNLHGLAKEVIKSRKYTPNGEEDSEDSDSEDSEDSDNDSAHHEPDSAKFTKASKSSSTSSASPTLSVPPPSKSHLPASQLLLASNGSSAVTQSGSSHVEGSHASDKSTNNESPNIAFDSGSPLPLSAQSSLPSGSTNQLAQPTSSSWSTWKANAGTVDQNWNHGHMRVDSVTINSGVTDRGLVSEGWGVNGGMNMEMDSGMGMGMNEVVDDDFMMMMMDMVGNVDDFELGIPTYNNLIGNNVSTFENFAQQPGQQQLQEQLQQSLRFTQKQNPSFCGPSSINCSSNILNATFMPSSSTTSTLDVLSGDCSPVPNGCSNSIPIVSHNTSLSPRLPPIDLLPIEPTLPPLDFSHANPTLQDSGSPELPILTSASTTVLATPSEPPARAASIKGDDTSTPKKTARPRI
ncbi:hypothetical protein E1B28_006810 [Marasmius oreades]|uniref:Uncharacterized protein n=1 Tax=Marasmius oreades TaxID=181124 RepID=A0A9P7UWV5_9AGAR|nr:uncharacterized protein E1B28_006810 [Marasmius oreades]KAG7096136.1 hypothetical protein E1B28_006810 [Marasmius oreades]